MASTAEHVKICDYSRALEGDQQTQLSDVECFFLSTGKCALADLAVSQHFGVNLNRDVITVKPAEKPEELERPKLTIVE